jgi:hypothetical protein
MTAHRLADLAPLPTPTIASNISTLSNHLSLKGTATPNATVVIHDDGVRYKTVTADSSGNWTYDEVRSLILSGSHQITARVIDKTGNQSEFSKAVTVMLDTDAPALPTWKAGLEYSTFNTSTPRLSGKAEAGALVTILNGTIAVGSTTAESDGTWSMTVSSLADGQYMLTTQAQDAAGNTTSTGPIFPIGILTKTPSAPTVTPPGEYVLSSWVSLEGMAAPKTTIAISENGTQIYKIPAFSTGRWVGVVQNVAEGSHTWQITATDAAGNTSIATELKFKVDTIYPDAPVLNPIAQVNGVVESNQPLLNGRAEALAAIQVIAATPDSNGNFIKRPLGSTVAGVDGAWQVRPELLPDGFTVLEVSATDGAGHASLATVSGLTIKSAQNMSGDNYANRFTVLTGNHAIDGNEGIDTVVFSDARASVKIGMDTAGYFTATKIDGGNTQLLINVERLQFIDKSVALDVGAGANGGMVYRLYQAAFDRTPDAEGVGYWLKQVDSGTKIRDVADSFLRSAEFANLMGSANPDNKQFLSKLYANILHRTPDQAGYDYWIDVLNKGADRAEVLAGFSEGTENQAQVIGSIKMGFDYIPFG